LDEGFWNVMVSETAPDEVVVNLTKGIAPIHKDYIIPTMRFFRIPHHKIEQFSVFQNPILAMCKALLDVVVKVLIDIQVGLQSISDER